MSCAADHDVLPAVATMRPARVDGRSPATCGCVARLGWSQRGSVAGPRSGHVSDTLASFTGASEGADEELMDVGRHRPIAQRACGPIDLSEAGEQALAAK